MQQVAAVQRADAGIDPVGVRVDLDGRTAASTIQYSGFLPGDLLERRSALRLDHRQRRPCSFMDFLSIVEGPCWGYAGPDDRAPNAPFQRVDVPTPVPGPGEALVRIHASGVNPLDVKIRAGAAGHACHPLPAILGIDLAGVIEAVGAQVTRFRPGDEVYGMTGGVGGVPGSLAEYAAVDAELLAIKPARLTMREAAALPLVAITAWEGLVDRAGVRADQRVLILGGAGGVGHIAIQIARARGAQVLATDRAVRAAAIEQLGVIALDRAFSPEALLAEAARHAQAAGRLRRRLRHRRRPGARRGVPAGPSVRPHGVEPGLGHARAGAAVVSRSDLQRRVHIAAAAHGRGSSPSRRDPRRDRRARRRGPARATRRSADVRTHRGRRRRSPRSPH
jgi:hypothetical protein